MSHLCSRLLAVAWAISISILCFGQSAPPFTTETSPSGPAPLHMYAVDVNNDGRTDVIMDSAQPATTGSYFAVSINNGDGTFLPPVNYTVNSDARPLLTWGDFNNDGKIDIAAVLPQTRQVAVYLGNGDGTFQSPITTTIALPAGMNFYGIASQDSIVAADFNHDGNVDLVVAANDGNEFGGVWAVYLLQGDGTGGFANPIDIYDPTSGWTVQRLVVGDFNTDGNADVGLLEEMTCSSGTGYCWSNVLSLFGDGGTSFQAVDVTYVTGTMTLGAADLNGDGTTDLYGIQYATDGSEQLAVFPGYYDRKFSYLYTPVPSSIASVGPLTAVADFTGIRSLTLAGLVSGGNEIVYFINAGIPNQVLIVTGPSPASGEPWQVGPVAGSFNGDTKPDIAVTGSPAVNSSISTIAAGLNTDAQGFYVFCNYPSSGQGIDSCGPTPAPHGAVEFSAAANSFGQLRKIELWLDGVKIGEDHSAWGQSAYFDFFSSTPSSGTHYATYYAADVDNRLQRYDFTFTTP